MPRRFDRLENAIIEKALREPAFLARLLEDPRGFLKALAQGCGMNDLQMLGTPSRNRGRFSEGSSGRWLKTS